MPMLSSKKAACWLARAYLTMLELTHHWSVHRRSVRERAQAVRQVGHEEQKRNKLKVVEKMTVSADRHQCTYKACMKEV